MSDGEMRDLFLDLIGATPGQRERLEPRVVAELKRRGRYFDHADIWYEVKDDKFRLTLPT